MGGLVPCYVFVNLPIIPRNRLWATRHVIDRYRDYNRLRVFNMIYKGDPLPASGESTSTHIDDGTNTYIAIYESECMDYVYLPENGKKIGAIRIRGLEDSKKGDETILTVNIDRSGLMELKAVDKRTGKTVEVEIQLDGY